MSICEIGGSLISRNSVLYAPHILKQRTHVERSQDIVRLSIQGPIVVFLSGFVFTGFLTTCFSITTSRRDPKYEGQFTKKKF